MPLFDVKGITPKQPTKQKHKPQAPGNSLFSIAPKPAQPIKKYRPNFIQPGQFTDEELPIAEKIQQRRLQLLVHSYIYYRLDANIIEDKKWDEWAVELVDLQNKHPDIASRVVCAEQFIDWDASTGFHLPFDEWVENKARQLLDRR